MAFASKTVVPAARPKLILQTLRKSGFFLCFALLLLLTACPSPVYIETDAELGESSWKNLEVLSAANRAAAGPYNAILGFRLELPEGSYVLGAYIWSNGVLQERYPLRLDLQNAMGGSIAKLKEDQEFFLLFNITDNEVILSDEPRYALSSIGIPMPFLLSEFSLLLNGLYTDFFVGFERNGKPVLQHTTENRQSIFKIEQGTLPGFLTLNPGGNPVIWRSTAENGWDLELAYQDFSPSMSRTLPGPSRIKLTNPKGYSISVQVKNLKKLSKPFNAGQLDLPVPSSATARILKNSVQDGP
jgi:hypothetical protein